VGGVADTNVIDLVAEGPDGQVLAVMIEDRPWGTDQRQLEQLKEKFNSYLLFITTGQYEAQIPGSRGRPVTIQLHCTSEPPADVARLLEFAEGQLATYGIDLEVLVTIDPTAGHGSEASPRTAGSWPPPDPSAS
jgi:hypothetical protein